LLSVSYSEDDV